MNNRIAEKLTGLWIQVLAGQRHFAAAELPVHRRKHLPSEPVFSYGGGRADAIASALESFGRGNDVTQQTFQVRLLRFRAAYLFAVWLKSSVSGGDLFIVLPPAPGSLKSGEVHTQIELVDAATALANRVILNMKRGF